MSKQTLHVFYGSDNIRVAIKKFLEIWDHWNVPGSEAEFGIDE